MCKNSTEVEVSDSDEDEKSTEMSSLVPPPAATVPGSSVSGSRAGSVPPDGRGDGGNSAHGSNGSMRNYRRMRSIVIHRLPLQEAMKNGNGKPDMLSRHFSST